MNELRAILLSQNINGSKKKEKKSVLLLLSLIIRSDEIVHLLKFQPNNFGFLLNFQLIKRTFLGIMKMDVTTERPL